MTQRRKSGARILFCILLTVGMSFNLAVSGQETDREILFQVSTLNALLAGVYDGQISFEELKKHGDTGIGTFEGLDGEMIQVDGEFYQIKADGLAYPVSGLQKTPFAVVTYFDNDRQFDLTEPVDMAGLTKLLDKQFPTDNIFYVIKISGEFSYIKTRSVPKQQKPYPVMSEVTKTQPTFELNHVKGTIVGVKCPPFVNGINLPGYHFHFITADKKAGGHLLECKITRGSVAVDGTYNFDMRLSRSREYFEKDLSGDKRKELEQVEK